MVLSEAKHICDQISIEPKFSNQKLLAAKSTVTNEEEFRLKVILPSKECAEFSITERFRSD